MFREYWNLFKLVYRILKNKKELNQFLLRDDFPGNGLKIIKRQTLGRWKLEQEGGQAMSRQHCFLFLATTAFQEQNRSTIPEELEFLTGLLIIWYLDSLEKTKKI